MSAFFSKADVKKHLFRFSPNDLLSAISDRSAPTIWVGAMSASRQTRLCASLGLMRRGRSRFDHRYGRGVIGVRLPHPRCATPIRVYLNDPPDEIPTLFRVTSHQVEPLVLKETNRSTTPRHTDDLAILVSAMLDIPAGLDFNGRYGWPGGNLSFDAYCRAFLLIRDSNRILLKSTRI